MYIYISIYRYVFLYRYISICRISTYRYIDSYLLLFKKQPGGPQAWRPQLRRRAGPGTRGAERRGGA